MHKAPSHLVCGGVFVCGCVRYVLSLLVYFADVLEVYAGKYETPYGEEGVLRIFALEV